MNKRIYHTPAINIVLLLQQRHLLAGSNQSTAGPSADYMKNPGMSNNVGGDDDEFDIY